jgi:hypothetical protein
LKMLNHWFFLVIGYLYSFHLGQPPKNMHTFL